MLSFDRSWLARPVLLALGCGSLLGFAACGGAATGELGGSIDGDGDGGSSGRSDGTGGAGGNTGGGNPGGSGAGSPGGSGGRTSGSGGTGAGGVGGSAGVGGAGFAGAAGSFTTGGAAGVGGGSGGFSGTTGAAGSASMPGPSICVDLSSGLAGLPSRAFPAPDDMVDEFCGPGVSGLRVSQAICLPSPGPGQSCTSFYPDYLITQLYQCGGQSSANFLCGPQQPLPDENGCRGDECCYVLVGDCN